MRYTSITTWGVSVPELDVRNYVDLATAVATIASSQAILLIPAVQNVSTNLTIPSNIALRFTSPGSISVAAATTLTIRGPFSDPGYQIFSGAGTVSFGKVQGSGITDYGNPWIEYVSPVWWGAVSVLTSDLTTDSTAAFQAALNTNKSVFVSDGLWNVTAITLTGFAQALFGNSSIGSVIRGLSTSSTIVTINNTDCFIYGLYVTGPNAAGTSIGISSPTYGGIIKDTFIDQCNIGLSAGSGGIIADNLIIDPCTTYGIYLNGSQNCSITNFQIAPKTGAYGIYMNGSCLQNYIHQGQIFLATSGTANTNGIAVKGGFSNTFSNLNIKQWGGSGILIDTGGYDNTITNCQIRSNGKNGVNTYGVEINNGNSNKIIGNTIYDDAGTPLQTYGVFIGATSKGNIVANNTLSPNATGTYNNTGTLNRIHNNSENNNTAFTPADDISHMVGTYIYTTGPTIPKVISSGSVPTLTNGTGAGTGPTTSIAGNDMAGVITILTGTIPAGTNADILTVIFNAAYAAAPKALALTPANAAAAALSAATLPYVDIANILTTQFKISSGATALTAATTYKFHYHVIG